MTMDSTFAVRIIRTVGGVSTPIMLGSGESTAAVADNTTYTTAQNATFSLVTEDTANIYISNFPSSQLNTILSLSSRFNVNIIEKNISSQEGLSSGNILVSLTDE